MHENNEPGEPRQPREPKKPEKAREPEEPGEPTFHWINHYPVDSVIHPMNKWAQGLHIFQSTRISKMYKRRKFKMMLLKDEKQFLTYLNKAHQAKDIGGFWVGQVTGKRTTSWAV